MPLVFAYGSNMCRERLTARVPSARAVAVGWLDGYAFRLHKRGYDGSAKADAWRTGHPQDRLWGVVFRVSDEDRRELDRCEGVGVGYEVTSAEVQTFDDGPLSAVVYVARPDWVADGLVAFTWYKDFVTRGADQHGLPADYRATLADHPTRVDPDPARHALNVGLVNRGEGSP